VLLRYASSKFFWSALPVILFFGSLQLNNVQIAIFNRFIDSKFDNISGFFPFSFTIHNLNIKDTFFIDKLHVPNLLKSVQAETLTIAKTKDKPNIPKYFPILTQ
jgi:hypothetical protein